MERDRHEAEMPGDALVSIEANVCRLATNIDRVRERYEEVEANCRVAVYRSKSVEGG